MPRLPATAHRLGARSAGALLALSLALAWPATARDSVDEALGGFDDETDAALDGFDDSTDETEAALDGFDEAPSTSSGASAANDDRFYDVSGSLSLGATINVVPHRSSIGPGDSPEEVLAGTDYVGLQRLRSRGDLQVDVDLPYEWQLRAQGFLWFDFAYLIHGRDEYTDPVINDYEFVAEVLDLWVAGTLFDRLDVKLGRQVVNWGRSDTVRVTDVLNSLDNREPGLTDIENLRIPSTMAKLDYYAGPWSFTALVVPEIRYDYWPPPGNDFFVLPSTEDFPPPLPPALPLIDFDDIEDRRADRWGSNPEYGGAVEGIFSGWDIAFYAANIYQNRSTLTPGISGPAVQNAIEDDRVTMVGGGGNYTRGSWLFKAELAWFKDVDYVFLQPVAAPDYYQVERIESGRVDAMGGVEYYGIVDTTIALEVVNRHIIDYDPLFQYFPSYVDENSVEYALRVTSDWMNARLHTTLLAYVLGYKAQGGAIIRGQVGYDVLDGLVATFGFVGYVPGEDYPLRDWGRNQRAFLKIKYSF